MGDTDISRALEGGPQSGLKLRFGTSFSYFKYDQYYMGSSPKPEAEPRPAPSRDGKDSDE